MVSEKVKTELTLEYILATPCGLRTSEALSQYYMEKGKKADAGQARLWGIMIELFISYCASGIDLHLLRNIQYSIKDKMQPVDIGCRDYDELCSLFFKNGNDILLLFSDGSFNKTEVDASLLKEAIDFLRDGQ